MDFEYIRPFLEVLNKLHRWQAGPLPAMYASIGQSSDLPPDLLTLFSLYWPQTPGRGELGTYSLHCATAVMSATNRQAWSKWRLLEIGAAANGAPLVLDLAHGSYPVFLVDHETLHFSGDGRPQMAGVAASCIALIKAAAEDSDLPCDYYDAIQNGSSPPAT